MKGTDTPILVKNPINPDLSLWMGALERTILAEKTWEIKNEVKKAYQSHKAGESISVKNTIES